MDKLDSLKQKLKLGVLNINSKITDLKFFLKKAFIGINSHDRLEYMLNKINDCNEKGALKGKLPFSEVDCQKAKDEVINIISDIYNSDNPLHKSEEFFKSLDNHDGL